MINKGVCNPVSQAILLQLRKVQDDYLLRCSQARKGVTPVEPMSRPLLMTDSAGGSFQRIATMSPQQTAQSYARKSGNMRHSEQPKQQNDPNRIITSIGIQISTDPQKWVAKQVFKKNNAGAKQTGMIAFGKQTRDKSKFCVIKSPVLDIAPEISPIRKTTKKVNSSARDKMLKSPNQVSIKVRPAETSRQDTSDIMPKVQNSLLSVMSGRQNTSNIVSGSNSSMTKSPRLTLAQLMNKNIVAIKPPGSVVEDLPSIKEEQTRAVASKSPGVSLITLRMIEATRSDTKPTLQKQSAVLEVTSPRVKTALKETPPSATKLKPGQLKMGKTLSSIFGTEHSPKVSRFDKTAPKKSTNTKKATDLLELLEAPVSSKQVLMLGEGFLDSDLEDEDLSLHEPRNKRNAVLKKTQMLKIPDKLNSSFELAIPSESGDSEGPRLKLHGDADAQMFHGFSSYIQ